MKVNKKYLLLLTSLLYSYVPFVQDNYILSNVDEHPILNNIDIGDTITFKIRDLREDNLIIMEKDFFLYNDILNTRFFVEITSIDNYISFNFIDTLIGYFTEETPNSSHGYLNGIKIEQENLFGLPPNVDESGYVNILVHDILDNFENTGAYIAGYFDPLDQEIQGECILNCMDIVHIDCNPIDLKNNFPEKALYTLAHEYNHLLHFNADPCEGLGSLPGCTDEYNFNPWLNEGLADLAPYLLGLGEREYSPYFENTHIGLDYWYNESDLVSSYYGKSALFLKYLHQYYGMEMVQTIFSDSRRQGLQSIAFHIPDTIENLFLNFVYHILNHTIDVKMDSWDDEGSYRIIEYDNTLTTSFSFRSYLINILNKITDISYQPNMIDENKTINLHVISDSNNYSLNNISLDLDNFQTTPSNKLINIITYNSCTDEIWDEECDGQQDIFSLEIEYDKNHPINKKISIYPNVITYDVNFLNISAIFDISGTKQLRIFDLNGKIVFRDRIIAPNYGFFKTHIDLGKLLLASGQYFIQIQDQFNIYSNRFIYIK